MVVALPEVALGDGDFAMGAIAEFNPGVPACVVGADEFLSMLDSLRDHKVGGLKLESA